MSLSVWATTYNWLISETKIWQVQKEFSAGDELGIDFEEKAFYDILKEKLSSILADLCGSNVLVHHIVQGVFYVAVLAFRKRFL